MDRFQVAAAFIVCYYLGAVGYVLRESGFVDVVRYRIKRHRENYRKDD